MKKYHEDCKPEIKTINSKEKPSSYLRTDGKLKNILESIQLSNKRKPKFITISQGPTNTLLYLRANLNVRRDYATKLFWAAIHYA